MAHVHHHRTPAGRPRAGWSEESVEATAKPPPLLDELDPQPRPARCLTTYRPNLIAKPPVEDNWIDRAVAEVRRRARAGSFRPPERRGSTSGDPLHARRRVWILGNADTLTHRLVRELAVGTGAAVVFVEYDRSPEAHYPVAIEQGYATAQWIVREGAANQLDPNRMAVAGDSVGGGMTAALTLMAEERGDVRFVQQSMYYPVTDAAMDTGSDEQFAEGILPHREVNGVVLGRLPSRRGSSLGAPRLAAARVGRATRRPAPGALDRRRGGRAA